MRVAFPLIAQRTHVAHVNFDMGDPLGIVKKSGGLRGIESCRAQSTFRIPRDRRLQPPIFAGFRSHLLVRTAFVAFPASSIAHFAHLRGARGRVDDASKAIRVGHRHGQFHSSETTMKNKPKLPKRSSSAALTPTQRPRSKGTQADASTQGASNSNAPKTVTLIFTKDIKFLGVGVDADQARYLVLEARKQGVIMRVGSLSVNAAAEFARLERAGVPLISSAAQNEFVNRAQQEADKTPTYRIVNTVGWHGSTFYFPDEAIPQPEAKVEFYPDQELAAIHSRFVCAGTRNGTAELLNLFRGNSRLITFTALSLVGPLFGIMPLEVPSLQVVGDPGSGKTAILVVASATWGWDDDGFGFGTSWATTLNALEVTLQGYHQTLGCFNETRLVPGDKRSRPQAILDAIMVAAEGTGKARYKEAKSRSFFTPIASSSNDTVVSMLRAVGRPFDAAYVDRLMDIPEPAGCGSFFENLHGREDLETFVVDLKKFAEANHGFLGRAYVRCLAKAIRHDPEELVAFIKARRDEYKRLARSIPAPSRNLARVHGKFATTYAAGCLGIRFRLLPLTGNELRHAILTCERDHVALVAREVGHDFNSGVSPQSPAPQPLTLTSPYEVLKDYVFGPRRKDFVDLRKPGALPPQGHAHATCPGYLGRHRGQDEVWLPDTLLEQLVGGRSAARAVKSELEVKGLIVVEGQGATKKYVVKRKIPGLGIVRVVALRLKPLPVAVPRKRPRSG
jgi:hypothetical protein